MHENNYHNNVEKWAAVKHKSARPFVIKHKIVRDTVVHVLTGRGKSEMEREKTGATINSTLVMRRERRGHRETERWKTDPKNETPPVSTCRSQPKIILLFITQTTEVRNNQCMCNTAMSIIIIINPKRTTCTRVIFSSLNKQPVAFTVQAQNQNKKMKIKWGKHLPAVK